MSAKNGKMASWKSRAWLALAVLFLSCLISASVWAAGAKVVSVVVSGDSMYAYVRGISDVQPDSTVQIGAAVCDSEDISFAKAADLEVPMRTLILLDNSKSIPADQHEKIQEIMLKLTESAIDREQFRIGTVSDALNYLCDFTSDQETLNSVIGGLSYQDQDTYLSDVLYDVISELRAEDTYVYTRIVIISDGADDKAIGYTNDEVRSLIEDSPYPVYTIGIPASGNDSELETMFSFSRASSAEYFLLDDSANVEDVTAALLADQSNYCIRVALDPGFQDGSRKNVLLKLSTSEGMAELTASADMPFGTGVTETPQPEEPEVEAEPEEEEELPVLEINSTPEPEEKGGLPVPVWVLIAAGVLIAAALAAVLIVVFRKKKQDQERKAQEEERKKAEQEAQERKRKEREQAEEIQAEPTVKETVYDREEIGDKYTYGLWGKKKGGYCLVLTNLDKPGVQFKKSIGQEISIGRENTDIVISGDDRLSRKHCKIILRGHLLYLKDLNSKNGTFYQETRIYDETPIVSGGKIKIGRYHYSVELIME